MRRAIWPVSVLGIAFASILTVMALPTPLPAGAQEPTTTVGTVQVFLPGVLLQPTFTPTPTFTPLPTATPTDTPIPTPNADWKWDERLTQRFAELIPATVEPGQGYWKLVQARWFGPADTPPCGVGDHDIAVDVRDGDDNRVVGKQLRVGWWIDGDCAANRALLPEPLEGSTSHDWLRTGYVEGRVKRNQ